MSLSVSRVRSRVEEDILATVAAHSLHDSGGTGEAMDPGENARRLGAMRFEGDIPDEFMCKLSLDIMTEPVYGGSSPVRMERMVIERRLRDNAQHPFTREPFSIENLCADQVLKAKIEKFMQSVERLHRNAQVGNQNIGPREVEMRPRMHDDRVVIPPLVQRDQVDSGSPTRRSRAVTSSTYSTEWHVGSVRPLRDLSAQPCARNRLVRLPSPPPPHRLLLRVSNEGAFSDESTGLSSEERMVNACLLAMIATKKILGKTAGRWVDLRDCSDDGYDYLLAAFYLCKHSHPACSMMEICQKIGRPGPNRSHVPFYRSAKSVEKEDEKRFIESIFSEERCSCLKKYFQTAMFRLAETHQLIEKLHNEQWGIECYGKKWNLKEEKILALRQLEKYLFQPASVRRKAAQLVVSRYPNACKGTFSCRTKTILDKSLSAVDESILPIHPAVNGALEPRIELPPARSAYVVDSEQRKSEWERLYATFGMDARCGWVILE